MNRASTVSLIRLLLMTLYKSVLPANVTIHYVRDFAIANTSVVCNVHAPYTHAVESFGNISSL